MDGSIIGYTDNGTPYSEVHECPYCGSTVYLYSDRERRVFGWGPSTLKCGCCHWRFTYDNSTRIM